MNCHLYSSIYDSKTKSLKINHLDTITIYVNNQIAKESLKIINYLLVGFAFSIPISKAGTNLFEALLLTIWIVEGRWKYKFDMYKSNLLIKSLAFLIGLSIVSLFWASNLADGVDFVLKYRHFLLILVIYTSLLKEFISSIFSAFLLSMF